MAQGDFHIKFDIDPVVLLKCLNEDCKFNMMRHGSASCNLKNIVVDEKGICVNKELSKQKENDV